MRVHLFIVSLFPAALFAIAVAIGVMRHVDALFGLSSGASFAVFVGMTSVIFGMFFALGFKVFGLEVTTVRGRLEVVDARRRGRDASASR